MTPRRPYLLRAFYDWLLDNQLTPHTVVDVTRPDVQVPMEFARDGQIVLNIAPRAVGNPGAGQRRRAVQRALRRRAASGFGADGRRAGDLCA